jgi:superfamily II DNA or RNA helicase
MDTQSQNSGPDNIAVEQKRRAEAKAERQRHVEAVLRSTSARKVVVAGPGTGKTYLFKRLLAGKAKTLTLTFVNALVEDLSLELCGISDVRTLHGSCPDLSWRCGGHS